MQPPAENRTIAQALRPFSCRRTLIAATAPTEIFVPRGWMKKKLTVSAGKWRYDEEAQLLIVQNPAESEEARVEIE